MSLEKLIANVHYRLDDLVISMIILKDKRRRLGTRTMAYVTTTLSYLGYGVLYGMTLCALTLLCFLGFIILALKEVIAFVRGAND